MWKPRGAAGVLLVAAAVVASALAPAPPAAAQPGPADSYGYIWVDSNPPSPTVSYSWVDIVSRGTRLTLPDEGCTFEVSMGFQFRFYGTITDYVYICSNGFVTFAVPDSFWPTPPIPSPAAPNNRVVALGMDLNPAASGSGGVYFFKDTASTPKRFVVTWNGVYKFGTTRAETFQIILEQNETAKDGRILFQYRSVVDVPADRLVGIENKTGSSGLAYPNPIQNNLAVAFLPPTDAALPPDRLRVTSTVLAPASVDQGVSNLAMVRLEFTTPQNWVDVTAVRVVLSGAGAGPEDVNRARLWLDDGDGFFLPGPDVAIAQASFTGSPPNALLQPQNPLHVTTTSAVRVFVAYDVTSTAGVGDWIGARLPDASYVSVAYPDTVDAAGFPIETYQPGVRTAIVSSRDTLLLARAQSLLPANVSQWETDVPALLLQFTADKNFVDLASLRVSLDGTSTAADAWAVKAVRDLDGNNEYTPDADEVLAIAPATGAPPSATLPFSLRVSAGSTERLLILLDVSPDAVPGRSFNLTVNATDVRLAGGQDTVSPANFPAVTGNRSIVAGTRPALVLPWLDAPPRADGIWMEGEYLTGPANTAVLDRPAGNAVPGYVTAENGGTTLYLAVDAVRDTALQAGDGVAIVFDTDRNGAPTDGADDAFLANATGGGHYRYNAGGGAWTLVGECTPITVPACASGSGVTVFGRTAHRFYEFAIPLATLGLAPGATVHFALAGPPFGGLADAGNRSTWPMLYPSTMPNLAHFGALVLSPGPAPNRPPSLNWTGEPGYETDGLEPESGLANGTFAFRILYVDPDNDPPAVNEPHLHVLDNGTELSTSPYRMLPENPRGGNYRVGAVYYLDLELPCEGRYSYYVTTKDARGLANSTEVRTGPQVACPDRPPALSGESVSPFVGTAGRDTFAYRVVYADPEGREPVGGVNLTVRRDGVPFAWPAVSLAGFIGQTGDYAAGAYYSGTLMIAEAGTNYTFQFRASDGNFTVETAPTLGPYVLPPAPDVLTVSGVDLAPLIVDEGARGVPFLGLLFLTTADVNVTGLRVDLTGSIPETEVSAVHLYHDVNGDRVYTPGTDLVLGTDQPLGRRMDYAFSPALRVTSAQPVSLLLYVDLVRPATPDATVRLEVRDASYVTVGPGDVVSQFPGGYRSTPALVNVPPVAADLTVDGHPLGSPGILHVLNPTPVLAWRFSDANGADLVQAAYDVSVSEGPTTLWSQNTTGAAGSVAYPSTAPALQDGRTYLLKVSVSDGRVWSGTSSVFFRMNTPPPAPSLLAPSDFASGVDPNVTLLWNPVLDADGDDVVYTYWVSETPGFSPALSGTTPAPGVTLALSPAKTYYWKVGASDGYEFAGNGTVWRFSTSGGTPGARGEILGRVVNGTTPLAGAFVELLVGDLVVNAHITNGTGRFRFADLAFQAYVVRVSAFGFQSTTRNASPTDLERIVDLGDVSLTPYRPPEGDGDGGGIRLTTTELPLALLVVLLAIALVLTVANLGLSVWRRRDRGEAPTVKGEAKFACPVCGRSVDADATRCECGAEFEAPDRAASDGATAK